MMLSLRRSASWAVGLIAALLLAGCTSPSALPAQAPVAPASAATAPAADAPPANLTDGCVERFDPAVDYFPEKVAFEYADGVTVEYFNHYKVVTVLKPWPGTQETFQYVLVQCGTPAPAGYEDATVIEIPVASVAVLSSTILPGLAEMGLLDRLVGLEEFDYINTPAVREEIEAGKLVELADGGLINIELALDLDPDAIMTFAFGSPEYDNHPKLVEAGLKTVLSADYMEATPLGRAEWLKYTSLYFNAEGAANRIFDGIAVRYRAVADLAAQADVRPTVFTGGLWGGAWYVPGGQSYFARFLADAGADYLWADEGSSSSLPMDFELVYDRAAGADVWLPDMSNWRDRATVLAEDERYAEFKAFQSGAVYNNSARANEFGGNDYYESGVANPDVVLSDLIAIFHPELLPNHELVYYEQLPPKAGQE